MPAGGTGGQVLTKNTNLDGDAGWYDRTQIYQDAAGAVWFVPAANPWVDPNADTTDPSTGA